MRQLCRLMGAAGVRRLLACPSLSFTPHYEPGNTWLSSKDRKNCLAPVTISFSFSENELFFLFFNLTLSDREVIKGCEQHISCS